MTSKFVNFVISSLWWLPVTCPPRALWHVRVLSIKPCLRTQLQKHNRSYWGWGHLITWNGPMMGHLYREGGDLNKSVPKIQMPRGLPGGMLKLWFVLCDLTDYHYGLGSVRLCSKNRVLCFQASPVKQGYYAQNYARLEV